MTGGPAPYPDSSRENLERLRDRAGLTQAELGYRASLHRTEISLLERGGRLPVSTRRSNSPAALTALSYLGDFGWLAHDSTSESGCA